jgi:hypothetical protein
MVFGRQRRWSRSFGKGAGAAVGIAISLASAANAATFVNPTASGARTPGCGFDSTSCAQSGSYHTGVDFAGDTTTPILATADGVVALVQSNDGSNDKGEGNSVILRHETTAGEVYTQYSHMSAIAAGVQAGACVPTGAQVGTMGGTGYGESNYWPIHLHFEVKNGATLGAPNGASYWGYTPTPAENYGWRNPEDFLGKVSTTQNCRVDFDSPQVFSSNTLTVAQGDHLTAVMRAHYVGLQPIECGWANAGEQTDLAVQFRDDSAGAWPASAWRSANRVAAVGCIGQLQPGGVGEWNFTFYVPASTTPGDYRLGDFGPIYDAPMGAAPAGAHSSVHVPISLHVVARAPAPTKPGPARRVRGRLRLKSSPKAGRRRIKVTGTLVVPPGTSPRACPARARITVSSRGRRLARATARLTRPSTGRTCRVSATLKLKRRLAARRRLGFTAVLPETSGLEGMTSRFTRRVRRVRR